MSALAQRAVSLTTVFLDQPPSCLQFCAAAPNYFVVGTYLLSESPDDANPGQQTKTGSLQLWNLDPASHELSLIQTLPLTSAVFDLHFHPRDPNVLAITTSAGSVALFNVSQQNATSSQPVITHLWTLPVHGAGSSASALFLAWAPERWFPGDGHMDGFAVTFSDARTAVFGTSSGLHRREQIVELGTFEARHQTEVWFVALAMYEEDFLRGRAVPYLFTGDDFGALSTRCFASEEAGRNGVDDDDVDRNDGGELVLSLLSDYDDRARHHTAGVTAILPLPLSLVEGAPVLLTGSYDEFLRVYHATRKGHVLAQACLGGGVWRLQMLDAKQSSGANADNAFEWNFIVLASCMHAGTRVVRVTWSQESQDRSSGEKMGEWTIEILAEFTEHESMNYASDVWKVGDRQTGTSADPTGGELLCISSSFYDKRLCVWRVKAG